MREAFTTPELLAVTIARHLQDGDHCFIGLGTGGDSFMRAVGVPSVACELARLVHGKDVATQYGVLFEPRVSEMPRSFSDSHLLSWRAEARVPVDFCLDTFRRGRISVGFISGAQVDVEGNVNSVLIGSADKPRKRLVGAIAQTDHACFAGRTVIVMKHEARSLVPRVDFVSAAGYPNGRAGRKELGLPGGGPELVVTDLAIYDFDDSGRIRLQSVHPGVSETELRDRTGFVMDPDIELLETPTPEERELRAIRETIDPNAVLLTGNVK